MQLNLTSVLFLIGTLFSVSLSGQNTAIDSIALKYVSTIQEDDLKKHLEIIASDDFEGRETGKKGQKLAAEYIAQQFKLLGLKQPSGESYYQNFPLIEQGAGGISLSIDGKSLEWKKDFYAFPRLLKASEIKGKEIVFGGDGSEEQLKELELKGKVLMLFSGRGQGGRNLVKTGISAARKRGAKAVFLLDEGFEKRVKQLDHYLERAAVELAKEEAYDTLPVLYVNSEVVSELWGKSIKKVKKWVEKGKIVDCSLTSDVLVNKETTIISTENVLGIIEGTEKKEEVVVITAHYDHLGKRGDLVFNGADDDGSGTVALLELAEAFTMAKQNGHGSKRSILFMAVSGEEKGLLGSAYYVQNPVLPLENTTANLNIDMIGRYDEQHDSTDRYVYVIGADKISKQLHTINEEGNTLFPHLELDYKFNDDKDPNRFYYRSDHYNFAKNNIPVIFYFSGVHEDYHKATDTIDKIVFSHLKARTQLVFITAWKLANLEGTLEKNNP